ncbi:protein kinase [Streptosporangium sp. NPDC000239]|uniref:protein kinase domain-containing protein n=1 Tax=Streptosporangium sp. NPDC000239 TaxID=3154248 RepID=UPI003321AB4D
MIRSRYRLLSTLAQGGMGAIWLARDVVLDRHVALKEVVLTPYGEDLSVRTERALREARAAASVGHPGIVKIYDVFLEEGRPWIVMDYIKGRSLLNLIEDGGLGERELARIGVRVLDALSAAHRAGVVHRDVKPANIVISEEGEVFLVDFGIAQINGLSGLTTHNALAGTPDFMAPERVNGGRTGPPADLWSLGVTLFHALEGYSPFRRDNAAATMGAVLTQPPPPLSRGGRLSEAVVRLLEKDPARRMGADELARVLRSVVAGPIPPPPPRERQERREPPERQNRQVTERRAVDPQKAARRLGAMAAGPAARLLETLPKETAQQVVSLLEPRTAGGILLELPESQAAAVLVGLQVRDVGGLLERMAVVPARAASVLQMMSAARAGRVVDYIRLEEASAIVGALPSGEAARILAHAHVRTAAGIVRELSGTPAAVRLVEAMPLRRACDVLCYVPPAVVATALRNLPAGLAERLLDGLDDRTRGLVLHHLKRP